MRMATATATTTTTTAFDFAFWVRSLAGLDWRKGLPSGSQNGQLAAQLMHAISVLRLLVYPTSATSSDVSGGSILDNLPNSKRIPQTELSQQLRGLSGTSSSIAAQLISRSVPTRDGVKQTAITKH